MKSHKPTALHRLMACNEDKVVEIFHVMFPSIIIYRLIVITFKTIFFYIHSRIFDF